MPSKASGPWLPVKYEPVDVSALRALKNGEASPEQQVHALEFILETVCARNDMSFRPGPDGARESAFAEGRRFVGNQIVKIVKIPIAKLKQERAK